MKPFSCPRALRSRILPALCGAWVLLAACGCTTRTVTHKTIVNPELNSLEKKIKLLPSVGEDGVSSDRSSFEQMKFGTQGADLDQRFRAPNYQTKEFSGAHEFGTGESDHTGAESRWSGQENTATQEKKPSFFGRRFREGNSVFSKQKKISKEDAREAGRAVSTYEDRFSQDARRKGTDPEIIADRSGQMSEAEVRRLLNRE